MKKSGGIGINFIHPKNFFEFFFSRGPLFRYVDRLLLQGFYVRLCDQMMNLYLSILILLVMIFQPLRSTDSVTSSMAESTVTTTL